MNAQQRKALYVAAAAIGAAFVVFGVLSETQMAALVGLVAPLAALYAAFKTVDPLAVDTPEGPVAGDGSDLPNGTAVVVAEWGEEHAAPDRDPDPGSGL